MTGVLPYCVEERIRQLDSWILEVKQGDQNGNES